mmetsp:Transcript_105914/g.304537  ORF Transcript_105914/g.304537 Transcript_105914/m.304537 type:complete len:211 (-) Transcript_105914:423-1055(-)
MGILRGLGRCGAATKRPSRLRHGPVAQSKGDARLRTADTDPERLLAIQSDHRRNQVSPTGERNVLRQLRVSRVAGCIQGICRQAVHTELGAGAEPRLLHHREHGQPCTRGMAPVGDLQPGDVDPAAHRHGGRLYFRDGAEQDLPLQLVRCAVAAIPVAEQADFAPRDQFPRVQCAIRHPRHGYDQLLVQPRRPHPQAHQRALVLGQHRDS